MYCESHIPDLKDDISIDIDSLQDAWPAAVEMYRNSTQGKKDVKITVDTENFLTGDV